MEHTVTCFSPMFCAVYQSFVFWSSERRASCCRSVYPRLLPAMDRATHGLQI